MQCDEAGLLYNRYSKAEINQKTHPGDVMYRTGANWYWSSGRSALQVISSVLAFSWITQVRRVLDLPCGHGRVTRHLRAAFPEAELYCCDIDGEGAAFCAAEFKGVAIESQPDLTRVPLPGDLDLIWVGSLFTHLDQPRTASWLAYLVEHLRPHGIIVATFHGLFLPDMVSRAPDLDGASLTKINKGFTTSGWGYDTYRGSADYGFSRSHPATVMRMATEIPQTRVIAFIERGWCYHQDVLALAKQDRLEQFRSG